MIWENNSKIWETSEISINITRGYCTMTSKQYKSNKKGLAKQN